MSCMRCSTPPIPFGIFRKSPRPISFWSLKQNGQWSVETTARSSVRSPRHRSRACGSCLLRSGVEQTHLAPSKPGAPSWSSSVRYRYCGHVSANTFAPRDRAALTSARASEADTWTTCKRGGAAPPPPPPARRQGRGGEHVHDVQRGAARDLGERDGPVRRLRLKRGGPRQPVVERRGVAAG